MNRIPTAMSALVIVVILLNSLTFARAAGEFPFDAVLLLDVAPMRPLKRVPILTVAADGSATIELWCRTANARVQIADNTIKIDAAPLPEALPQYMSTGQCSDDRMRADTEMLDALTQATEWHRRGDGVELIGPDSLKPLRFRASSH
jgi:META domain